MAKVEGQRLIIDLSEAEAKIAEKTLPVLSPMLELSLKVWIRLLLQIAAMGKEKWQEFRRRSEEGEDPGILTQEVIGGPEAYSAIAENLTKEVKFPTPEEIDRIFG